MTVRQCFDKNYSIGKAMKLTMNSYETVRRWYALFRQEEIRQRARIKPTEPDRITLATLKERELFRYIAFKGTHRGQRAERLYSKRRDDFAKFCA